MFLSHSFAFFHFLNPDDTNAFLPFLLILIKPDVDSSTGSALQKFTQGEMIQ